MKSLLLTCYFIVCYFTSTISLEHRSSSSLDQHVGVLEQYVFTQKYDSLSQVVCDNKGCIFLKYNSVAYSLHGVNVRPCIIPRYEVVKVTTVTYGSKINMETAPQI